MEHDGIGQPPVRFAVANVLASCASTLRNGHPISPPLRFAIRRVADEIRRELDPRVPGNGERSPAHPEG